MRNGMIKSVNKQRWPVKQEQIQPVRGGGTVVVDFDVERPSWSVGQAGAQV